MVNVRCGGSADSVSPTPLWVLPQPTHLETTIVPVSATGLNEYVCSLTDVLVPSGQISVPATGPFRTVVGSGRFAPRHHHPSSGPRRADRLVGALAAMPRDEAPLMSSPQHAGCDRHGPAHRCGHRCLASTTPPRTRRRPR